MLLLELFLSGAEGLQSAPKSSFISSRSTSCRLHLLSDDNHGADSVATLPDRRELFRVTTATFITASCIAPTAWATTMDPKTGIRLPDPGEIADAIPKNWDDVDNPFVEGDAKTMFGRLDNTPDSKFYQDPRFVEHVDDNAVQVMTKYISNEAIQPGGDTAAVLDLCSSWVSHIDDNVAKKVPRIAGLGMNEKELQSNPVLTEYLVQDLNSNPSL
ncbi:MAG: hypothetical protein SGARI_002594, partial [Bacillariaceae sp.]